MGWKIGEIKQVNGEWYQCVEGTGCYKCDFNIDESTCIADNPHCTCRSDKKNVIFKKLEKWGKPYPNADKLYQLYILPMNIEKLPTHTEGINLVRFDIVEIGIKQNKEDMEEKKIQHYDCFFDRKPSKSNLKPFSLELAKQGKPVCTRNGSKARIVCFDKAGVYPVIALVQEEGIETCHFYSQDGKCADSGNGYDLMMLPEKKEGWVNVYKNQIHNTFESAEEGHKGATDYIKTIKVEWEE